ncbi:MAG: GntR family transcriptional regulator [Rhizobiaceae bacterium]|nr:GntR family transcriptional regulator [Rhizobiaceae bacterium]
MNTSFEFDDIGNPESCEMPRPRKSEDKTDLSDLFSEHQIDRSRAIGGQVYELLRLFIILDQLQPGMQINELDIAKWLGVSRTPVREAYQRLMSDGLVITQPKVGSVVSSIDHKRIKEGIIIRRALEREVVRLICENDVDLGRFSANLALQKVAVSQSHHIEFFKQDEVFHLMLADLAGIPTAWKMAQSVKAHIDRARIRVTSNLPDRMDQAFEEHLKLIEALKQKQSNTALDLISQHIEAIFSDVDKITPENLNP